MPIRRRSPTEQQSTAGKARLTRMSPEERSAVASAGAKARWAKADPERANLPTAEYGSDDRPVVIGSMSLPCYVLSDERRVLSAGGFQSALSIAQGGSMKAGMSRLELFASGKLISPFIDNDLADRVRNPIHFITPSGKLAYGYEAETLVMLCEAVLAARAAKALQPQQAAIAHQCELIMRGLARVGIVGMVDEATGYQTVRSRDALGKILEQFIAKELQPWAHPFPDEYYDNIFRLRGLNYPGDTVRRPQYFGHLTNDIIYRRLAPGVLEELKRATPKTAGGKAKTQLHRRLTPDLGHPKLREHLASVVTVMKLSDKYDDFKRKLDRVHPRYDRMLEIDLSEADAENGL